MPLSDEDKKKYKDLYLQSAKPYMVDLQKIATMQDTDVEALEVIHRAAHSMGSQSLMMEYKTMGQLSRLIEKIFKTKLDEGYVITPEMKDVLVKDINRMSASLSSIETNEEELDLTSEIEELHTVSKITV